MTRPSLGGAKPAMIENSVLLPAPFGPISAVMRRAGASNDARSRASKPPKRFDTCSTRNTGSTMAAAQGCRRRRLAGEETVSQVEKHAGDSARRERDDQDEDASVDDEIEARRIAGHELGDLSERLDHQRAEERAAYGADAADDGCEQSLDRDPWPIGDAGVDEEEILGIEAAGRRGDRGRDGHGQKLHGGR